jgi:hypothetical protein
MGKKKLLVMSKPPKPISEMTDEERHEYAEALFNGMKANLPKNDAKTANPSTVDDLEVQAEEEQAEIEGRKPDVRAEPKPPEG